MRHYQGLSLAETAEALGITENAAKLRLFRARKAFAEIYEAAEPTSARRPVGTASRGDERGDGR